MPSNTTPSKDSKKGSLKDSMTSYHRDQANKSYSKPQTKPAAYPGQSDRKTSDYYRAEHHKSEEKKWYKV
ncbi:MAG: hypothetical protein M1831_003193 [Alyxoria varia]|nr:MAG: hypothetical protein M1831_003193 [Alyxoria varia]